MTKEQEDDMLDEALPSPGYSDRFWQPIETFNRKEMSFVLTAFDGAVRTMLWNPAGYWEHPNPMGSIDGGWLPEFWAPIPPVPIIA